MVKARTCCLHGAESSAPRLDQHVLSEMCNHTSAHSLRHVCVCVVLAVPASAKLLFIFEKCNNCASGKLLFIFDKCNNCASGKLLFISDKCNNCASVKLLLALPRVGTSPCWHFPAPRVGKSPCFHGTQHQKPTSPRKTPQTDKTLMIYRNPHETTRHRPAQRRGTVPRPIARDGAAPCHSVPQTHLNLAP